MARDIAPRLQSGLSGSQSPTISDTVDATNTSKSAKRRNVTSACIPCRDRKTKCDGLSPCSRCVASKTECIQPRNLDRRTTAAIKRKFDLYEQDQQLLSDLLESIRSSTDEQVAQIVSLVRSNAQIPELRACLSQQLTDLHSSGTDPSAELNSVRHSLNQHASRQERRPSLPLTSPRNSLQIARLIDDPPFQVSASPWTTITEDDALVSNLVSVWLTWDHLMYNRVDSHLFLRDMREGSLDAAYCSPLLVNCILAWACPYSDYNEARSRNGKTSQLMHAFTEEAKRLVEPEIVKGPSLTLVQSVTYLYLVLSLQGQDKLGYQYKLLAIDLAQRLSRSYLSSQTMKSDVEAEEMSRAIDYTCWGAYNTMTASYLALLKPQTMTRPRRPRPQFRSAHERDVWVAYPSSDVSVPCYTQELFDFLCDISTIVSPISRLIFGDDPDEDEYRANIEKHILPFYLQLVRKLSSLPSHLQPTEEAPLSVLVHRLWIIAMEMAIVIFLKQPRQGVSAGIQQLARDRTLVNALDVARICRCYRETYSNSLMVNSTTQATSMALFVLIELSVDNSDYANEITDLCIFLRALSRRWPLCSAILRMVQLDARQRKVKLPPKTDKLFEDFETSDWKANEAIDLIGIYPALPTLSDSEAPIDLGQFIREMERFELQK